MPQKIDLSYAIGLPPEKAVEYFRGKELAITFDWQEMVGEAHAKAFTVAKAVKLDVLEDIHGMVQKSITQGITLQQFREELTPRLQAKGWWGKKEILNPATGEVRNAQLGSPRRLKTIYETNLSVAYSAARYKDFTANADERPYWQYVAVRDAATRPTHAALNGMVFRHDDPFWDSFWPPIDWGCRCRVRALSKYRLDAKGLSVENSEGGLSTAEVPLSKADPDVKVPVTTYTTPTGEKVTPGPGWSYNQGKTWSVREGAKGEANFAAVPGQKTWKDYSRPDIRDVPQERRVKAPELLPEGKTKAAALPILMKAVGLDDRVTSRIVKTPIEEVALREELLVHPIVDRQQARERYGNFIVPTLVDPFEIYLTEYEGGIFRTRYIGLFTGKTDLLLVVDQRKDGSLLWNFMQRDDKALNKSRVGKLLYEKE